MATSSKLDQAGPRRLLVKKSYALFLIPAGLYLALLAFYPFGYLMWMSLNKVTVANIIHGAWPFVGLENFQALLHSLDFQQSLPHTLVFVAVVTVVGMLGGLAAATILQARGRMSALTLSLMTFIWAMPPVVLGSLWKFLLLPDGLINTVLADLGITARPIFWLVHQDVALLSVSLVNSWAVVPFNALVYRAALLDIPTELLDASAVDGATNLQQFTHIKLPLLLPVTLILAILTIVYAFRSFDFIYVMTHGGPGTVTTTLPYLSYRLSFVSFKFGSGAATAVFTVFVVFVLAFIYVRVTRRAEGR